MGWIQRFGCDHSWALVVNPLHWKLGYYKVIGPVAQALWPCGKPSGRWSGTSLCGVRICRNTFEFTCEGLGQSSLSSTSHPIRCWHTLAIRKLIVLAQVWALATDPTIPTSDWVCSILVGWYIVKDVRLPLKYNYLVNAVPACSVCSKQHPKQLPK